ncbi:class I adenylate-forming enzyme family protein [Haloferula sp. A504]|uniref:class I adenylate-forming enzyme family protein n=1 Tax=Haloferula sp. A504 TaxID=3373601 RepID=UPI0031C06377|nr:AMP-binding protein [Verrucomicrobiaceae bacterium E54]
MLLNRWKETLARSHDRPAIFDGDEVIRFRDLDEQLGELPEADGPVVASGSARELVIATLRGWRDRVPVLPVERAGARLPALTDIPEGVAHLKLTPGTDGMPRTVRFTASQIAADADRIVRAMGLTPEIPNLATISLAHSYGFSSVVLPLLLHGIPLRTVEVPFPAVVAAAWAGHEAMVVPAVPSMWRAWLRSGILENAPIHLAVSAGAPLPLDLERSAWEAHGLKLHNFYGASECGGISWDPTPEPRTEATDLGEPLPGVKVSLDENGRFLIESDSVALGYDHSRNGVKLGGGKFLTTDVGRLENGRLHLDCHADGHINVAGRKIGPGRVEAVLLGTGLVNRIRVFGIPSQDPERVDEVAALVPVDTDLAALRSAATAELAGWETPRQWFTDPTAWNLSRMELRKRFASRRS